MFRFAHPEYLYLLALIPVFIALYFFYLYRQKKRLAKFGDMSLVKNLMIGVSPLRRHLKFTLLLLALTLAIFLCARPQYGTRNEEVKRQGIEAIIAVDVSNSMLCQDVKPSRLDKSKMLVSKLIEQLDQDRIGLVAFAGTAITLLPITSDYVSAKMFLDQLSPASISVQGTNMADAIQRATAGFSDKTNVGKALILITDAEDHEDGALEAAKEADKKGIRIYVLSVGTENGGPIPLGNGNYKKDNSGNTVTTKLNEEVGKQIAKAAGGIYIKVDQTDQAQRLLDAEIEKMQKEDITSSMYSEYDEQFVAVALLLLLVLIIEVCIMEKKNPLLRGLRLFKDKRAMLLMVLGTLYCADSYAQSNERDHIRMGNAQYRNGQYQKAETSYRKSIAKLSSMEAYYNLGNALAMQGKDSTAFEMYKKALEEPSQNTGKKAQIYHNMGNLTYVNGVREMKTGGQNAAEAFQQAVELYKSSLRLNPDDNETRYNLAMAQYQLKKSQEKQQQQQQQQQNKQQQQQEQQQQQQQEQEDQKKDEQQQQQPPPPKKDQIDEKTAEQLLNSAQQDEKNVQQKVQQNPNKRRSLEKDW